MQEGDEDYIFHGDHDDESAVRRGNRDLILKNYHNRKIETKDLRKAIIALSNSIPEQPQEKEKEDDCDIFGRLVAKRMRMIQNPVIRLVAEQEISACIVKNICQDSGIKMTTPSASTEERSPH